MARLEDLPDLLPEEREALARGRHEQVARALEARGRPDLAARIHEALWDFPAAVEAHLAAGDPAAALEAALSADDATLLGRALEALERAAPDVRLAAARRLQAVGRRQEAAALLAGAADPAVEIRALAEAGEPITAAGRALEAGLEPLALEILSDPAARGEPTALALEARARWRLGDAEGAVRCAQAALRANLDDPDLRRLLADGLSALGYETAARLVAPGPRPSGARAEPPPRFRVEAPIAPRFAGTAFLALDRITLEAVEVHLLLAEAAAGDRTARERVAVALREARAGDALGHPAVTPVRLVDPAAGLLILPHLGASPLADPTQAIPEGSLRAFFAFLASGLAAGHRAGLVSGGVFPSQFGRDALGRPCLAPFGVHHLHPLAGTQTAGLEERLALSAPEVRAGEPWTAAADVYALARALVAFARRSYAPVDPASLAWPPPLGPVVEAALAERPGARPSAEDLARALSQTAHLPVLDPAPEAGTGPGASPPAGLAAVWVEPAQTWSDPLLDALAGADDPWVQPILDRNGRRIGLAGWPEGSRVFGPKTAPPPEVLPPGALEGLPEPVRRAVEVRLRASSLVRVPSGDVLVALDDVLTR